MKRKNLVRAHPGINFGRKAVFRSVPPWRDSQVPGNQGIARPPDYGGDEKSLILPPKLRQRAISGCKLVLLLIIAFSTLSFTHKDFYKVKYVYDGDTILLITGAKVRYLGIDAPEIGRDGLESEYMALASRAFNRQLLGTSRVKLEFDQEKMDRHGRLLAYAFLEDGTMVNALLVRKGLAHVLPTRPNLKYSSLLLGRQRQAMRERIGLWGKDPEKRENHCIGSRRSYRFHRPACPFGRQIDPHHFMRFNSRLEAFWRGFSPCGQCDP